MRGDQVLPVIECPECRGADHGHDFVPSGRIWRNKGICEVCGGLEGSAIHVRSWIESHGWTWHEPTDSDAAQASSVGEVVWVVETTIPYEGSTLNGIFSTETLALRFIDDCEDWQRVSMDAKPWVLDDPFADPTPSDESTGRSE